jgi:hypothetical protein
MKQTETIKKLKKWRNELVEKLRKTTNEQQKEDILKRKIEIDRALACLEMCNKFDIQTRNIERVLSLPAPKTGYFSEYRIVDDAETEDRKYWQEFRINGKKIFLHQGDIILKKK